MSWSTTTRYASTVADGGLALVQDLMNTIPAGRPRATDLLQDVETAPGWAETALADWAEVTGRPAPAVVLDERGLEELQALRADLRGVVGGGEPPESAPELRAASIGLSLAADGQAELTPRGQGWRVLVGQILIEVLEA